MSNQDTVADELMHGATLPQGTEVAAYATHAEAQAAVDYLSDHDFDIREVTIVGTDIHLVEHITGRLTPLRVAFSGATSGLLWGAFLGLMMSFVNTTIPGNAWIAIGLAGGAMAGMTLALISYLLRRGQRDFMSHTHVIAGKYALVVARNVQQASDLLRQTAGNQMRPTRAPVERPVSDGPTEYGSRPDEKPRFGVRISDLPSDEEARAQAVVASATQASAPAVVSASVVATEQDPGISGQEPELATTDNTEHSGDEQENPYSPPKN